MKFAISLLISVNAYSSPIFLNHEGRSDEARIYKTLLTDEYAIPQDLITMKKVENCSELRATGKLNLCLKNNGDLILVSVDREFISDSLKVFRAP